MRLGIIEHIDCAHFLPGHSKCGQIHGHTYEVEIVIEGESSGGMVVDFADLKSQARAVLRQYDHRNWNDFLEFPSVENICDLLARQLRGRLVFPFTIRVWEGHGKWAEMDARPQGDPSRRRSPLPAPPARGSRASGPGSRARASRTPRSARRSA